jgi:hypothetical protein
MTALAGRWVDRRWLAVLVGVDVLFMLLHVGHVLHRSPEAPAFAITLDGGHAERWQYAKTGLLAVGLAFLAWRRRHALLAAWSALYGYALLDDMASLHERAGHRLARAWRISDAQGELVVFATVGTLAAAGFAAVLRGSPGQRWNGVDTRLLVLAAVLVLFGVGVDYIHSLWPASEALALLEDGGELVAMSALAAFVAREVAQEPLRAASRAPFAG